MIKMLKLAYIALLGIYGLLVYELYAIQKPPPAIVEQKTYLSPRLESARLPTFDMAQEAYTELDSVKALIPDSTVIWYNMESGAIWFQVPDKSDDGIAIISLNTFMHRNNLARNQIVAILHLAQWKPNVQDPTEW